MVKGGKSWCGLKGRWLWHSIGINVVWVVIGTCIVSPKKVWVMGGVECDLGGCWCMGFWWVWAGDGVNVAGGLLGKRVDEFERWGGVGWFW